MRHTTSKNKRVLNNNGVYILLSTHRLRLQCLRIDLSFVVYNDVTAAHDKFDNETQCRIVL